MITLTVNSKTHHVQADPDKPLLWLLRDELGLKGTKYGCGVGVCGACLVLLDGEPNHACMVPLGKVGARQVTTIEGLREDHPLIQAWIAEQTPQCGYCQPAQIIAATALLQQTPNPDDAAIDAAAQSKAAAPAPLRVPELLDALPEDAGVALNEWIWINRDNWSALRGREALQIECTLGRNAQLHNAKIEQRLLRALEEHGTLIEPRGDAKRTLGRAAQIIEAVYQTPYLAHATIEPMNCVAHVRQDACDVWVGTQDQQGTRAAAARITGLPEQQVRVHTQFLGGGFGRRLQTDFVAEAVHLSRDLGVPVQVIWTRADDLQHDFYRPAHAMWLQAALDKGGLPSAWFARVAGPGPALDGVDLPYAIPHVREEHLEIDSAVPVGAWRSVGASNNAFPIECFIDELAHRAGRDPLEYRIALLDDAPRHRAALELAANKAGWGAPIGAGRGRGVAVYHSFDAVVAQVAEVSVTGGVIRVERVVCAIDCGIVVTPDAVRAQNAVFAAIGQRLRLLPLRPR